MRKIPCWLLILTLVTAGGGVPEPLHAQALPAIAVGAFIRELGSSLEAVIRQAEQSSDRLLIRAGTQANIAVNNAVVAFDDVLSKRIDQLDDVSRQRLAALQSLVESVRRRTFEDVDQVARQTQTVVSMLPLSDKTPRLDGLSPTFIVPASLSYPVELRLRGSFLSARDARLAPQLAAGGQSFPLQANPTDQELRFSIPVQLLADASKPGFGYTKATLTVPYETRALLGLRRVRKMATYNLLIGTLPATPGTIKVFHKVVTPDHERQHVRWPARGWLYQDSGDNDIPQDASDGGLKLYQADPPPAGWSIDPATVRFVEGPRREGRTPGGGDWERRWEHRTNIPAVTFGVATIKRTFGHRDSGKMDFAFEYDIVRPAPRESWSEEVVVLKWGDSRVFPYTSGNYRVEFTAFDGTSHQWTGANSNPFLHVADQADSLRLEAQHPRTLIWP